MQSAPTAVDGQQDGQPPQQAHQQRGVELIQSTGGPLGRHGGNAAEQQPHPGNTSAFMQKLE